MKLYRVALVATVFDWLWTKQAPVIGRMLWAIIRSVASEKELLALNLQQLGKLIKERRETLGLSQQDVADATHLHRTYISDIERGQRNITIGSLQRVAIALDIQLSTLARLAEVADAKTE